MYVIHMYGVEPDRTGSAGDYDAILDTPTTQIFPFLLAAFPRARVIHTVRDSLASRISVSRA